MTTGLGLIGVVLSTLPRYSAALEYVDDDTGELLPFSGVVELRGDKAQLVVYVLDEDHAWFRFHTFPEVQVDATMSKARLDALCERTMNTFLDCMEVRGSL